MNTFRLVGDVNHLLVEGLPFELARRFSKRRVPPHFERRVS